VDNQITRKILEARQEEKMSVPTLDRRHTSWIRHGRQSAEVFCKNPERRIELGLPVILPDPD
jgi:hypothetical protein